MLETVPAPVETVIYLYFAAVATIGCYLQGRLWLAHRSRKQRPADGSDESPQPDG